MPQSFSADIIGPVAAGTPAGAPSGASAKLHVADRKTRIEIAGAPEGFFISDADAGTAWFVRPAQRLYMDSRQSTPLTQIFVAVDPQDPCRQWRAAAAIAGEAGTALWLCEEVDREILKEREILKYRVAMPDRPPCFGWIDAAMGFPVKWQAGDGKVFLVENIRLEAQPSNLFDVPPGYRRFDPQALIERIKRSDVWVEPPK